MVPGEDPAAWEAFREAMVADLAPVGVLETELADRVALLSWRLRRVSTIEAGAITRNSDKAARKSQGEPDGDDGEPADTPKRVAEAVERLQRWEAVTGAAERLVRVLDALADAPPPDPFAGGDAVFLLSRLLDYLPESDEDDFDDDLDDLDDDDHADLDPMTDVRHPQFLLALGVPAEWHDDPEGWCGWTAGVVQKGVERIARSAEWSAAAPARATSG